MRKTANNYKGKPHIPIQTWVIVVLMFLIIVLLVVLFQPETPEPIVKEEEQIQIVFVKPKVMAVCLTANDPPELRAVPEPEPEPDPEEVLVGQDLYDYWIDELCKTYINVRPSLIKAQVFNESSYHPDSVSSAGCIGLMQINPKWFGDLMESLGVTDLYDPKSNLTVGIAYMDSLMAAYKDESMSLMAYNGGTAYASRMQKAGKVSYYARHIIEMANEMERSGTDAER